MPSVEEFWKNINASAGSVDGSNRPVFEGDFRFNEPLAGHTTFKVGGPADLWVKPCGEHFFDFAGFLLDKARDAGIPVFILGGGSNLVVSDRGVRGIVLDTSDWTGTEEPASVPVRVLTPAETGVPPGKAGQAVKFPGPELPPGAVEICFKAGTPADKAAEIAADRGLSGLEFLAGMPGSIGGALWMNARAYDREMAGVVSGAVCYERDFPSILFPRKEAFSYKKSPFQSRNGLILSVTAALAQGETAEIRAVMEEHRRDREEKGHYRYPCAGSAFKNNRDFGKPVGKILDELGLRGLSVGDAQLAPWHGNIIINRGKAAAADIKVLSEELAGRVKAALGLVLESEIIFAGDWA